MLRHQPHDTTVTRTEEEESFMLSIDILRWPGVNQAFLFSFVLTTAMALVVIPFGKRRPVGTQSTWGEAMVGSVYTFFVLFLAFGVVPLLSIRCHEQEQLNAFSLRGARR